MQPPASFMDAYRPALRGHRHMTAAGHYLAAQAGFQVMEAGGNAIDAGVAAGIALGVVQSELVGVAGVAPIIIYLARENRVVTISGLGVWPKATDPDLYARQYADGVPQGILRCIVPAAPDAWITALEEFGTMSFGEVAAAAIRLARDGFVMYPLMAELLEEKAEKYARWPANAAIYLPGGRTPKVGELFRQQDLGASLQYMADQERAAGGDREAGLQAARAAFYRGDIARAIADYHADNGGLISMDDLAEFRVGIEPAQSVELSGTRVYGCGPWCQGPMLLQALQLLRGRDLAALGHNSPAYIHLLTEAIKLAAADREHWYGDPRFVEVPIERLLSEDYAKRRAALIRDDVASPGMPPPGDLEVSVAPNRVPIEALDTSYCCAVDSEGNLFSATPSDTSSDAPVIPGTGFVPSSRGSQSRPDPDHPSSIQPGKRPRLTPNPALAIRPGEWAMPFGTPGADVQIQAMMQTLLNIAVFGLNPQAAVEAPRFASYSFPQSFAPHAYHPGLLKMEGRIDRDTGSQLQAMGHDVDWWGEWEWQAGAMCAIRRDTASGVLEAGADPRRACYALGW
ncbi:MAG: gamma-glutamyltransferase family protein [Alphaproteobacteria bacterium]|jgi:gamma-glutamyltranspeptidase/glutathione hydrolase|nr:gamma-glutamyltransferase family protein [Alphaproteobacteria bacterium]MDP6565775.1 gamma-glutamyltransferase family protein [Alphaproteobacteria bacterium]MDP6813886.1 gamma-glutamyltransferase family protein [Alphaproteobacteria bacterium]